MTNRHIHHEDHDGDNRFSVVIGPSTTQSPYLVSAKDGVWFTSILSVGDQIGLKDDGVTPWRMVGIPDGLGAYDNGDGTITVLMNHELPAGAGVPRDYGAAGAFVSKLTVDKETLQVTHAEDLIQHVYTYNTSTNAYELNASPQLGRFCSADLPAVSAFYDANTGLGTSERIFLNGEEIGNEGRAFAHIVTGAEAGNSYELPFLGNFSWENSLANPASGAKTVVIGTDDSTPGEVYLYVGDKQATGSTIEKAGLTNGSLYGVLASFGDDTGAGLSQTGTFKLVLQGDNGDVSHLSGAAMNAAASAGATEITQFGRPEDGAWDPSNPNRFYFLTTGATINGVAVPTRLWAMDFIDVEHPELGGTIKALMEGSSSSSGDLPYMLDNMTVTESGLVIMQEDPGNNSRIAKIWMYDPNADTDAGAGGTSGLTLLGQHDAARFGAGGANFLTQDEESSGVVDVTGLLGGDQKLAFLLDTQAHYSITGELVEGGQLQVMYVDLPNPGDDHFKGTKGADTFDGGFGDDHISGGAGADTLLGNYGDDEIAGGAGDDVFDGGVGADEIHGDSGSDKINGGVGDDRLSGDAGNDRIDGGVGDDKVDGGAGADTLKGGFGNDWIVGGSGADSLEGNQGDDRLDGGAGNDTLSGGGGSDAFIFTRGGGRDAVLDFTAQDKLDFTDFHFKSADAVLHSAKQDGADVVIDLHNGSTVTLDNFHLADLTAANIIIDDHNIC